MLVINKIIQIFRAAVDKLTLGTSLFFRALKTIFISDRATFILLLITVAISSILPVLTIRSTSLIINQLVEDAANLNAVISNIMIWAGLLLLCNLSSPIVTFLQSNLADKAVFHINCAIIEKSNALVSLEHYEQEDFHNDLQVISSQAYNRPINFVVTVFGLLKDFFLIGYCLVVSYAQIGNFSLLVLMCTVLQTNIMCRIQVKFWHESLGRSYRSRVMSYISSLYTTPLYAKEMRLFPLGPYLKKKYITLFYETYNAMLKLRLKLILWPIIPSILLLLGNFFTLLEVVALIKAGSLQVGSMTMIVQLFVLLYQTVLSFGEQAGWLSGHLMFFDKYFNFLSKKDKNILIEAIKNPMNITAFKDNIIESISFENVSFIYPDGRHALHEINFTIKNCEQIAIVGANGSGKSTLVKLLCGFYLPTTGKILINGISMDNSNILEIRKLISPVFQDFSNYALSVEENILMGATPVDKKTLLQIISEINAGFIFTLPEQLQQMLGKAFGGTDLSTGQWQKIAILRALYKKAPIFILDEPTASLDPISECELFEYLAKICSDKTSIWITHRLTSVGNADKILLLDKGTQIAFDSHNNLLSINKLYKQMFESQATKYFELLSRNQK